MKKLITFSFPIIVLATQNVQAHSSHSEGMLHASEHLWLALVPAALWIVWSVLKSQKGKGHKSLKRKQG